MPLEYVLSKNGNQELLDQGHLYVKGKSNDMKIFWKCKKCSTFKCHAASITAEETVIKRIGEHNHATYAGCGFEGHQ